VLSKLDAAWFRLERLLVMGCLGVMSVSVFLDVVHRRLVSQDSAVTGFVLTPAKLAVRRQVRGELGAASAAVIDTEVTRRMLPKRAWCDAHVAPVLTGALVFVLGLFGAHTASRRRREADPGGAGEARAWQYVGGAAVAGAAALALRSIPAAAAWAVLAVLGAAGAAAWRLSPGLRLAGAATVLAAGLALLTRLMLAAPSRWTYVVLGALGAGAGALTALRGRRPAAAAASAGAGVAAALLAYLYAPEGFAWSKEVSLALLLWIGFLGSSMATHTRQHIMVDFARKLVPAGGRRAYETVSALLATGACALLGYLGYLYVFGAPASISIYATGARLASSNVPIWFGVAAIPVGLLSCTLRFAGGAVAAARGRLPEPQDLMRVERVEEPQRPERPEPPRSGEERP
jgi:TRAP-type C4-dicarboxylate transport system permease small subunit